MNVNMHDFGGGHDEDDDSDDQADLPGRQQRPRLPRGCKRANKRQRQVALRFLERVIRPAGPRLDTKSGDSPGLPI